MSVFPEPAGWEKLPTQRFVGIDEYSRHQSDIFYTSKSRVY
jgi:hypothetical protein